MQPLVLLRVVSTVNNWVTALMTAHCHLCVESVLQTCILLPSVHLLIIVLIFFLLRLSLQATQRLPRKAKRWWKGSNNKPRKRNSPSVQNARSAQGMIRHEKLRRRNESNARQSERGIDIVRKNRKRNVKESMKRSMKRNLTDNRKRKSIIEDIEMTMMTAEKSTEEMTDPGRGVIASAITTVRLAIAPLIPTMAFFWNQAQTMMTRVGPRYHIGGPKVDLTNLI